MNGLVETEYSIFLVLRQTGRNLMDDQQFLLITHYRRCVDTQRLNSLNKTNKSNKDGH